MRRRRLALSAQAIADLEEIRQYTAERFGDEQARRYLADLRAALDHLTTQPNLGIEIQPAAEIRSLIHGRHYSVLYRDSGDLAGRLLPQRPLEAPS